MPEISIIVPVYNAEKFLAECIDSILAQSYPDFELLLINDGSTDRSGQICEEYCQKDNRIQVIHQPNGGVTAARKVGWKKSNGEWIVFVDADDVFLPEGLNILINEAIGNNCEIVNASLQHQPGDRIWIHKKLGLLNQTEYLKTLIYNQTIAVPVASIYKKSIFQDSTFGFDPSIKIGEDVLMKIELALRVTKVSNLDEVIYNYRENLASVTQLKIRHPAYFERYYEVLNELYKQANNLNESYSKILQKGKFDTQLRAFFSPHLSFDENYYLRLNEMLKNEIKAENVTGYDRIYLFAIRNRILARLIKVIIYWRFVGKNVLKGNAIIKKEILY